PTFPDHESEKRILNASRWKCAIRSSESGSCHFCGGSGSSAITGALTSGTVRLSSASLKLSVTLDDASRPSDKMKNAEAPNAGGGAFMPRGGLPRPTVVVRQIMK